MADLGPGARAPWPRARRRRARPAGLRRVRPAGRRGHARRARGCRVGARAIDRDGPPPARRGQLAGRRGRARARAQRTGAQRDRAVAARLRARARDRVRAAVARRLARARPRARARHRPTARDRGRPHASPKPVLRAAVARARRGRGRGHAQPRDLAGLRCHAAAARDGGAGRPRRARDDRLGRPRPAAHPAPGSACARRSCRELRTCGSKAAGTSRPGTTRRRSPGCCSPARVADAGLPVSPNTRYAWTIRHTCPDRRWTVAR